MKAVCNVTHLIKCFNRLRSPLLVTSGRRFVHLSSLNNGALKLKEDRVNPKNHVFFTRHESQFYHRILEENPKLSSSILKRSQICDLLASIPDLNIELDADLSNLSPPHVLQYTAMLTRKLLAEELDPASPELVQFASYIKKNVKTLQKNDIPKILSLVYLWPATNKLLHPSMNTIIFSLDHACQVSVDTKKAPVEEVLLWMEPWHWLGLCTMSEFVQMATGKLFWNADKPEHIVQLLFYMGELRTLPQHYDRPSIEKKVVRYMKKFKPDEIGILAAGFYKSSTKVTNYVLYKQLVRKVVNDAAKFHDIPLNAVLKLMRGTILTFKEEEDVHAIYKALTPLVPTLSGMCLVQVCMLGTPMEITDRDLMRTILNILCNQKNDLREKDFQRVMYVCAIGMDEEDVRDFVSHTVSEMYRRKLPTLHHAEDAGDNREIYTKAISFIESVLFLHILGHRSSDLVASAIEMGTQLNVQPKGTIALYYLDTIVDLIFPNYTGPRLGETVREKHHSIWFPPRSNLYPSMTWFSYEWRETTSEMLRTFYLDVCDACGGNSNVACQSVLPLYAHRDLVVCTDNEGNFLSVPAEFGSEAPWRVKRPPNTDNRTFCVLMLLRDRSRKGQPDYTLYQRMREIMLRSLGYRIAIVRYKVFEDIPKADKCEYIRETIKLAR